MSRPEVLGGFEHQVLLVIARLDGEAYSVPIVLELEERTGREVASASVYVTLRRLEARGYLTSRQSPADGQVGRPRRMFRITAEGEAALREARTTLESLWHGLPLEGGR